MKKLVTILATLAFALSLGAPVFAAPRAQETAGQSTTAHTAKSAKAKSGKQHAKRSKKSAKMSKGSMKGASSSTPQSK